MIPAELAAIERNLAITLPVGYRTAVLALPTDRTDADARSAFLDAAAAVIGLNQFLRDEFPDDWPATNFAVGNSPCGDPYFLDLTAASLAVWCRDHETHEVRPEAADVTVWAVSR